MFRKKIKSNQLMHRSFLTAIIVVFIFSACEPQKKAVAVKKVSLEKKEAIAPPTFDKFGIKIDSLQIATHKVRPNESLYLILDRFGFNAREIYTVIHEAKPLIDVRGFKPGQKYRTYTPADSGASLSHLVWQPNPLSYVVFNWNVDSVRIYKASKPLTSETVVASSKISSSLYNAVYDEGASPLLGYKLADIFAWQVDFFSLREGDAFNALYEKRYIDDEFYGIGKVLAAEFLHRGEMHKAYYFSEGEVEGYFNAKGESVEKALLKAPFKFDQRISSSFNPNRFHPILNIRRPHYGTDYAAPFGTPVLSVGDGVVTEVGYDGGSGNIVRIRHNSVYQTAYMHLSDFAGGIYEGATVEQGQVIAYVGNTGMSTGPHLHYSLYKNDSPVNSLAVELPSSDAVPDTLMEEFLKVKNSLDQKWALISAESESDEENESDKNMAITQARD
jgi:murein DD-endopeptidase MepM/ murein hydrolase activator NlpD